jgi:TPR repeat protein
MNWLREYRTQLILLAFLGAMAIVRWQMGGLELPKSFNTQATGEASVATNGTQQKSQSEAAPSAAFGGPGAEGQPVAAEGNGASGSVDIPMPSIPDPAQAAIDAFNANRKANWEAACKKGDADSCDDMAEWLLENGNKQEAAAVLKNACTNALDNLESCSSLGELLSASELATAKSLCSDGNAKECVKYAGSLGDDKKSEVKALLSRACSLGMTSACGTAGTLMTASEVAAATESCNAGDAQACVRVAGYLGENDQESQAVSFIGKACDKGVASACLEWGENATKDAISSLERECHSSSPVSCLRVAGFLVKEGNEDQAQKLVSRACSLGNSDACKIADHIRKNR